MSDLVLSFEVPGPPVTKKRPRVTRGRGGYTPADTRRWEQAVGTYALAARADAKLRQPLLEPVAVYIELQLNGRRGDLDNYAKSVLDALNGVVFEDDSQVELLLVYRVASEVEKTRVTVRRACHPSAHEKAQAGVEG